MTFATLSRRGNKTKVQLVHSPQKFPGARRMQDHSFLFRQPSAPCIKLVCRQEARRVYSTTIPEGTCLGRMTPKGKMLGRSGQDTYKILGGTKQPKRIYEGRPNGINMSSPIKDALSEFINNNTSAIEKAMENESHDLSKSEPTIPDLVNYLSCPTPQPSQKDAQSMSLDEKSSLHQSTFNSAEVLATHATQFGTPPLNGTSETGQFSSSPCYSAESMQNSLSPVSHLQRHDSFSQNKSLYHDTGGANTNSVNSFLEAQTVTVSTFSNTNGHQNVVQSASHEEQFYHNGQSNQYQGILPSNADKQYQHTLQSQFSNQENTVNHFQGQTQSSPSNFQDSPVLQTPFLSSSNSQLSFTSSESNLGFDIMDVNQTSLNHLETEGGQFKMPEKMHVDEPDTSYHQKSNSVSNGQYQQDYQSCSVPVDNCSIETHSQVYKAQVFHQHSLLREAQQNTSFNINDNNFEQLNMSESQTSNDYTGTGSSVSSTTQESSVFDLTRSSFTPSSVQFNSDDFKQSSNIPPQSPQASGSSDYQVQQSPAQQSDSSVETTHYHSPQSQTSLTGNGVFSLPSSSYPSHHGFNSSQSSPYQGNQFQGSPPTTHSSPGVHDNFQKSPSMINSPALSPGYSQQHQLHQLNGVDVATYQQSPSSHTSSSEHTPYQPSSVGSDYNSDGASLIQSPDQQSVPYLGNGASSSNGSVSFSPSSPTGNVHQQPQAFSNASFQPPSAPANDAAVPFRGFSTNGISLHSPDMTSTGADIPALPNYGVVTTGNQEQQESISAKTTADSIMGNFTTVTSLSHSSHTGFSDDTDSYHQLDLEAVVNSFNNETNASSISHSSGNINSSQGTGYIDYQYSNIPQAAVSFPGTNHATSDINIQSELQYNFNQQTQTNLPVTDAGSYSSAVPAPSVSDSSSHDGSHQFGSLAFGAVSSTRGASESFPQPMQIQDSDFSHKIQEPTVLYSFHDPIKNENINGTETAMDISPRLGEKNETLPSGISYEEIHMSIVKAGDALSKNHVETKQTDQQSLFDKSLNQTNDMDVTNSIYATQASEYFQTDKTVSFDSQTMTITVAEDSGISQQTNLKSGSVYTPENISRQGSLSNIGVDHALISGLLNNLQVSSAAPVNQFSIQDQISKQNAVTVPNFLENPSALVSCVCSSNPDNVSLVPLVSVTSDQHQTRFVTMIAASPANSRPVVASSGMNQPKVAAMPNATSQQQILSPSVSLVTSMPANVQIINSVGGLPLSSSSINSTFLGQINPNMNNIGNVSHLNNTGNGLPLSQITPTSKFNFAGTSDNQNINSLASSGVFLQVTPQTCVASGQQEKTTITTVSANPPQTVKSTLNGLSSVVIPSGSNSAPVSLPHIIMSLEDLQKLLTQQNMPQSTSSLPHQQQQTTMSSPHSFILQKPPQRQAHPKLIIKGGALHNSPRTMQPHQQLQQTREKLQLLVHQTHQTQPLHTAIPSSKTQEHATNSTAQENQKMHSSFQLVTIQQDQQQQQVRQKLHLMQQIQNMDQHQPKMHLQLKQTQALQQQQNLLTQQQGLKGSDQKGQSLQLGGQQQQLVLSHSQQQQSHSYQKSSFVTPEPQLQQAQNIIQLAQLKHELHLLHKQQEEEMEEQEVKNFQHQQSMSERSERQCSDSLKKDYKHLHSLLTGVGAGATPAATTSPLAKTLPSVLNFTSLPTQTNLQLSNRVPLNTSNISGNMTRAQTSVAPFSFTPLNCTSSLPPAHSSLSLIQMHNNALTSVASSSSSFPTAVISSSAGHNQAAPPLTTLAFTKTFTPLVFSKASDSRDNKESGSSIISPTTLPVHNSSKSESSSSEKAELELANEVSTSRQASILAQILTERKRSHTPLSVDLGSPANSNSEAPSPLSSPNTFEDGNTQLTLIERSADLHIKSDTMQSAEDGENEENASYFDMNAFHKRPSSHESNEIGEKNESIPMKIPKPSLDADAHSSVQTPLPLEQTFDFGSAVSSTSNFSFAFGNKEDNSELFTFGSSTCGTSSETLTSNSKPLTKASSLRSAVPTQTVKPTTRKQKEYSLKAYYSSRMDKMELKILEQPESQHRARYQTEGSRGAIKDASQQGFPIIKLFGYNQPTKLQVFIGDECGRVKPHGFYQACRVCGKNSTACMEQEIEGTTVIEIEMLPENDMTVKLDCIGILKLRNADVERRIGPKRARDKKKNNTRARLVMRCFVSKPDGAQHVLQVASNPIVCTQPVGQPEISRMSLSDSNVDGGESLFIIGKNFKNKGTSVLFQKLDGNEETVVWQAEAEVEQEFFQPTHLICKIPPYKDKTLVKPEVAQIVVSCAGKTSDPQKFTYKPVALSPVKQEVPMETDSAVTSGPMSFVSPEALQLNQMVHQAHVKSISSSNMFQLPPGTVPAVQTSVAKSPAAPSQLIKPAKLFGLSSSHTAVAAVSPVPAETSSSQATGKAEPSGVFPLAGPMLPTFLLEERPDGFVQKTELEPLLANVSQVAVPTSSNEGTTVHSKSVNNLISPLSYAANRNHPSPTLSSSVDSGLANHADILNHVTTSSSSAFPSKPLLLVVDSTALQSFEGGDKNRT